METGIGPVPYDGPPPPAYKCGECGVAGVKLWRDYNAFLSYQTLRCCDCAIREQNNEERAFTVQISDGNGVVVGTQYSRKSPLYSLDQNGPELGGDQIGWRVPAVPTEDGMTMWGYTAVPDVGVHWWKRIPLRKL
jgi:hypothetical protein